MCNQENYQITIATLTQNWEPITLQNLSRLLKEKKDKPKSGNPS
jgi:hypothetical protein